MKLNATSSLHKVNKCFVLIFVKIYFSFSHFFVCCSLVSYESHYDTTMSFIVLEVFIESLISRRNKLRFCVKRSRLRVRRFRSTPSISISNRLTIDCCLSNGCDLIIFSRNCLKTISIGTFEKITMLN